MRKSKTPTPLQKLSDTDLAEVHSWFKRHTYDETVVLLQLRFGIKISRSSVARYYQRFAQAQLFNAVLWTPLTPADMLAIKNADPIPDSISQEALKKQCLRAAHRPDLKVADLKHLFDVFTYQERRQDKKRGQAIEASQLALRAQFQEYRRQLHSLNQSNA